MIIPVGFAQVNYIFSGAGFSRGAQVTLGLNNTADQDASAVAQAAADAWETNLLPLQSAAITLVEVRAKLGPNATGADAIVGVGQVGGEPDPPLPPNTASLVRKVTASGGRKNRGRMYVPGATDDAIESDGVYDPVILATWQTALNDFLSELLGADLPIVILHSHPDDVPTFVTGLIAQSKVATQRRRLRKAG